MRYKMGALVTEATGRIGGMVAMGKGSGGVMRIGFVPRKPKNAFALQTKVRLSSVASLWKALSPNEFNLWNSTFLYGLTGYELFVYINFNLLSFSRPSVKLPPRIVAMPKLFIVSVAFSLTTNVWNMELNINVPANFYVRIFFSKGYSAGKSSLPSFIPRLRNLPANNSKFLTLGFYITNRDKYFPLVGSKVFYGLQVVSYISGESSTPIYGYSIVT